MCVNAAIEINVLDYNIAVGRLSTYGELSCDMACGKLEACFGPCVVDGDDDDDRRLV